MYNYRSDELSLLSGYPVPAATQIRIRGLRPARDGYKFKKNNLVPLLFLMRTNLRLLSSDGPGTAVQSGRVRNVVGNVDSRTTGTIDDASL